MKNNRILVETLSICIGFMITCFQMSAGSHKILNNSNSLSITNKLIKLEIKQGHSLTLVANVDLAMNSKVSITSLKKNKKVIPHAWLVKRNSKSSVSVKFFTKNKELLFTCIFKNNSEYIEIEGSNTSDAICINVKTQIGVLPNDLAEDFIYLPIKCTKRCYIPSDAQCLMNMYNNGSSILACIWQGQNNTVYLKKNKSNGKYFTKNIIKFSNSRKLFLGLLNSPHIWHVVKRKANAQKYTKINWKLPFKNAYWNITYKIKDGLYPIANNTFDTWDLVQKGAGPTRRIRMGMYNPGRLNIYTSCSGKFAYPFYYEKNNIFYKSPVHNTQVKVVYHNDDFKAIIYPWKNNQLHGKYVMPYNKMREVLPKQIFNKLKFQRDESYRYPATCSVTEKALAVFRQEQAKQKSAYLKKQIILMDNFFKSIHKRINKYRNWSKNEIKMILNVTKKNKIEKLLTTKIINDLKLIECAYKTGQKKFKTVKEYTVLSKKIIKLIDENISNEKKEQECEKLGRAIRVTGAAQDLLTLKCRIIVKAILGHVEQKLASNDLKRKTRKLIIEIRKDCNDILRNRSKMEGK
jgi:hypothetical protein